MGNCYETSIDPSAEMATRHVKRLPSVVIQNYKQWITFDLEDECVCMNHFIHKEEDILIAGLANSEIIVWNLNKESEDKTVSVLKNHFASVNAVTSFELSSDGKLIIASGDESGAIHLWDYEKKASHSTRIRGHDKAITTLEAAIIKGQVTLVSGSMDGNISFWSLYDDLNSHIQTIQAHRDGVCCVSPCFINGKTLIISGGFDNIVKLWNPLDPNSKLVTSFTGHESWVTAVTTSKLNKKEIIVSGGNDNRVKIWNALCSEKLLRAWNPVGLGSKKLLMTLSGHEDAITSVITAKWMEYDENKEFVISSSKDGTVKVWDPEADLRVVYSFKITSGPVKCLTYYYYKDQVAIITGGTRSVEIWKK